MNSHDELRSALGAIAAEAPIELRRSEQVWARYRRNRRRAVALTVGVTAAAVLSVVAVVLPSGGADEQGLVTRQSASPSAGGTGSHQPPAATTGKRRPGGAGGPSPTAATPLPPPAVRPLPVASPALPTAGPVAPKWAVSVAAFATPTLAAVGQPVDVQVHTHAGDNGVDSYTVDWGDGSRPATTAVRFCGQGGGRAVTRSTWTSKHTYRAAGDYRITVTVRFGGCGRPPQQSTTTTRALVGDQPAGLADPSPPHVTFWSTTVRSDPQPRKVAITLDVTEPETYVAFAIVQWGDGTTTVLRHAVPDWCRDAPRMLDPDWPAYVEHTFARPGSYEAFAWVFTAPCEGGAGQGAGGAATFTV